MTNQAKMKLSVLAVAMLFSAGAWASLGRISVRSNLGETFRADIELTGVRSSELEGARIGLASPDTFRDLNVDYSGYMSALRFSVAPSSRGAVIHVSSSTPINEPYLRFVVEAKTSSGRSVREYTVLLDPASYSAPQGKNIVQDLPAYGDSNLSSRYQGEGKTAHARPSSTPGTLQTRAGSTLRGLAARVKPAGAGTEQTMAALVQANPHAFIDGNPNKLKAGITLKVPPVGRIKAITPEQARDILGGAAATAPADNAMPAQAQPAAGKGKNGDVLKLVPPEAGAADASKLGALEQQVAAREQSLKDAQARITALEEQLKALQAGKPMPPAASAPEAVPLSASAPAGLASAPAAEVAPQPASAPAPVVPKPAPKPVAPPPPPPEKSFLDTLIDNLPLVGGGIAGVGVIGLVVAALARRRKNAAGPALQVSTQSSNAVLGRGAVTNMNGPASVGGGHSFMTNFTQSAGAIDAAEVDPIAEAEVYMAYGRDVQAEEILKDALAKDPSRQEVRVKLLELYAARPDATSFEKLARELHTTTDGKGQMWAKVAAMGLAIDPANALYHSAEAALEPVAVPAASDGVIDLDKELFGDMSEPAPVAAPTQAAQPAVPEPDAVDPLRAALFAEESAPAAAEAGGNMLDFDLDNALAAPVAAEPAPAVEEPAPAADNNLLDFDFNLDTPAEPSKPAAPAAESSGFESLYEEMTASVAQAAPSPAPAGELAAAQAPAAPPAKPVEAEGMTLMDDPLSTKLDLAKVYLDMGDRDGAREVLQDLISEAQGGLKEEAQALLDKISS